MQQTTSVQGDVQVLVVLLGVLLLVVLFGIGIGRLRAERRPVLPLADRPPLGLGRLVPVGPQLDEEIRRGVDALEQWLAQVRRH